MEFDQFKRIVNGIGKRVLCPNCQSGFSVEKIEILSTQKDAIQCAARCTSCGRRISIDARVREASALSSLSRKNLSPSDIAAIAQSLKNCKDSSRLF